MTDSNTDGDDFDPTQLESLIIARPLLEMISLHEGERETSANALPAAIENGLFPVVIDLNFKFNAGLVKAKKNIISLIEQNAQPSGDGQKVHARKTDLSSQHIFATLRADTIRALAKYTQSTDGKKEQRAKSFREREIFMIWPDFKLEGHITKTVATIKADAVRTSFKAEGSGIVWAVVDSGIAGDHWHFRRHGNLDLSGVDRAVRHMDFTTDWPDADALEGDARDKAIAEEEAAALTDDFGHGSHVAGIIAGEYITDTQDGWNGKGRPRAQNLTFKNEAYVYHRRRTEDDTVDYAESRAARLAGIAPKAKLVSFKVLDAHGGGAVSNVIAALAQIQKINEYGRYLRIQGVNLSVGYPFNPEWFACGNSPLCMAVDRLVKSGVVVVVSAGNSGYGTKQTLMTRKVRAGMLMTINDPGNARLAITVGATHRNKPHEFGPSYFSSKGPTGDGRLKPDLLAPGERIISCGAGQGAAGQAKAHNKRRLYIDQSGTSMAAPHVSGAIAAFLSVRGEFIGQPERVKEIFVESATDLGRDRNMQGTGLLDLMRAIQSV